MNRKFSNLLGKALLAVAISIPSVVSAQITGPSTVSTPYFVPVAPDVSFTSILTAAENVNGYKLSGIMDGLGVLDNADGTFTLFINHEISSSLGVVRAHGSIGSFVSKWVINKQDLSVVSGSDLIQNLKLWNGSGYDTYNAANPSASAAISRLCSADLPAVSAFFNSTTGNGTQERIFMSGEETTDGRAFAHIVTGPEAGTSYQLPYLGKLPWENEVACPHISDKTIVASLDDGSTLNSNTYFYIGTKTNTGSDIEKAGLSNGKLYVVKVDGFAQERVNSTTINNPPAPGTHFDLVDIGSVLGLSGAAVETATVTAGGTNFSRVEDGAWDPSNYSDFYFATTDQIDLVTDGTGTQIGRSRLWRLSFTDINNPELGGTIEAVLDGTEGQNMMDNLTMDRSGHIVIGEDVGNNAHNGKIWDYNIATDGLTLIGKHDVARFGDIGIAATAPYSQDEESSGVIDVHAILGPGMYLLDDQAHYTTGIPSDVVEGGQLAAVYNPLSSDCNNYSASISPAGENTYCHGTDVVLRANGGYGFTYQWYKGNAAIIGATNETYTTTKKGDFHVVESNGTCSWTSPVATINRLAATSASIIAKGGLDVCATGSVTLKVSGGASATAASYSWTKDGVVLIGATSKKIIVSEAGSYAVSVTNTNGCTATSAAVEVVSSCKFGSKAMVETALNLYPNPAQGTFVVELNTLVPVGSTATVKVVNMLGQVVYANQIGIENNKLQAVVKLDGNVPAGNYLVSVAVGDKVHTGSIMYQK